MKAARRRFNSIFGGTAEAKLPGKTAVNSFILMLLQEISSFSKYPEFLGLIYNTVKESGEYKTSMGINHG